MKLRFRANSLRLRVNQEEVKTLASGGDLLETIDFPGNASLSYMLKCGSMGSPQASFTDGSIQIFAPRRLLNDWAQNDELGLYFTLTTGGEPLKVAIEKDLECIDGPQEEKDPNAFPRALSEKAC